MLRETPSWKQKVVNENHSKRFFSKISSFVELLLAAVFRFRGGFPHKKETWMFVGYIEQPRPFYMGVPLPRGFGSPEI